MSQRTFLGHTWDTVQLGTWPQTKKHLQILLCRALVLHLTGASPSDPPVTGPRGDPGSSLSPAGRRGPGVAPNSTGHLCSRQLRHSPGGTARLWDTRRHGAGTQQYGSPTKKHTQLKPSHILTKSSCPWETWDERCS